MPLEIQPTATAAPSPPAIGQLLAPPWKLPRLATKKKVFGFKIYTLNPKEHPHTPPTPPSRSPGPNHVRVTAAECADEGAQAGGAPPSPNESALCDSLSSSCVLLSPSESLHSGMLSSCPSGGGAMQQQVQLHTPGDQAAAALMGRGAQAPRASIDSIPTDPDGWQLL